MIVYRYNEAMKKLLQYAVLFFTSMPLYGLHSKLVVIIPSYNNERWYQRNLASVFLQDYDHYRVIYIDDCSTDNTYPLVEEYIKAHKQQDRVILIHNETRCGAMANWYYAIHSCHDDEIIVSLDGDDWFAHPDVLKRIAQEYEDKDTWMTYGSFASYPEGEVGFAHQVPASVVREGSYRRFRFITTHVRTFYAWLFKRVHREDLLCEDGSFFSMVCDQAMMFPMLEMARAHAHFIAEILYIYNRNNPLNDEKIDRKLSNECERRIRNKKPYEALKKERQS